MRTIKFRVSDSQGWHYYTLDDLLQGVYTTVEIDNGKAKAVCEFTGLKDKKGKEIYEGDIVDVQYPKKDKVMMGKNWKYIGEVKWMNNEPSFMIKVKGKPGADSLYRANEKCEIIGNIYEPTERKL